MGKRKETERWLGRADASFRHTVAPEAHLARVAYVRLALGYDTEGSRRGVRLVPSIARTFQKLGMDADLAKCRFLEAMSLKDWQDRGGGVRPRAVALTDDYRVEPSLRGMALLNLGNLRSEQGSLDQAFDSYKRALPLLQASNRLVALADLKLMLGGTLQRMGRFEAATSALRESVKDCVVLAPPPVRHMFALYSHRFYSRRASRAKRSGNSWRRSPLLMRKGWFLRDSWPWRFSESLFASAGPTRMPCLNSTSTWRQSTEHVHLSRSPFVCGFLFDLVTIYK